MKIKSLILLILPFVLTDCASTNPPGPEGTGEHKQGYFLGRSDAVKQQYWIVQNLQKQQKAPQSHVTYLPIQISGQTVNGVTTVPFQENLRVQQ
jgi:hypothetical protein